MARDAKHHRATTRRLIVGTLATIAAATSFGCAQRAGGTTTATLPATQPTATQAATRPMPFVAEIEAFERKDAERMPAPGGIVFVGSSTIRGWDTAAAFPELPVTNRGFGGSQMSDALRYVRRIVTKYQPKVVVLYEGDNDLASGKTPERVFGEIEAFAGIVRDEVPAAHLVLLSVKPSPSRAKLMPQMNALNALQREFAARNAARVTYFDGVPLLLDESGEPRPEYYKADKLHLTPAGYARWNDAIRPLLTKLIRD